MAEISIANQRLQLESGDGVVVNRQFGKSRRPR
jgi:hypothetical protein